MSRDIFLRPLTSADGRVDSAPTPRNATGLWLIGLELAQQRRDFGFRFPAVLQVGMSNDIFLRPLAAADAFLPSAPNPKQRSRSEVDRLGTRATAARFRIPIPSGPIRGYVKRHFPPPA